VELKIAMYKARLDYLKYKFENGPYDANLYVFIELVKEKIEKSEKKMFDLAKRHKFELTSGYDEKEKEKEKEKSLK
jgi:hypothetical protein